MSEYYNDKLTDVTPFNLQKAKVYMSKSAYPNGFELKITVPASYPMHVNAAQIIASQLAVLNIKCSIEPIEWATWLDQVYAKANYESTVIAFSGKLDPSEILIRYFSTYKKNFTRFNNADYDKAFTAAETEVDQAKRVELYKECQRILAEPYTIDGPQYATTSHQVLVQDILISLAERLLRVRNNNHLIRVQGFRVCAQYAAVHLEVARQTATQVVHLALA